MVVVEDSAKLVAQPVVSLLCITYNQAEYIARCLDGFLEQQTNFPVEIIVNDDCSTDGTTDIVLSYQQRHPEAMRVLVHEQNQYSLGKSPMGEFLTPRARGRYIAMCEGDDFWTDPHKLQRQFEFMEAHPEYACCVHANTHVRGEAAATVATIRYADHDCRVAVEDITSRSQCYSTNSMFVRTEAMSAYHASPFFTFGADGDHKMLLYFGLIAGGIYYLNEVMSAYRMLSKSSVNRSMLMSGKLMEVAAKKHDARVGLLRMTDEYTEGKYHDSIARGIESMDYAYYRDIRDLKTLRKRWPERLRQEGLLAHVDLWLYTYCKPLHGLALRVYMR